MKIAVYVEGQTELIFVRDFLLKWFNYDTSKVGIRCFELRSANSFPVPFEFLEGEPEREYTIINVGGDERALSKALSNACSHRNSNFKKVVVLRDMFSEAYKRLNPEHIIDKNINDKFINGAQTSIAMTGNENFVFCHFAVMEVEAWLLGMGWFLIKHDKRLTQDYLQTELNFDLEKDPELEIFHPAVTLKKIYQHIGADYRKHSSEVEAIMSKLMKSDFELLLEMNKCDSFQRFAECLIQ